MLTWQSYSPDTVFMIAALLQQTIEEQQLSGVVLYWNLNLLTQALPLHGIPLTDTVEIAGQHNTGGIIILTKLMSALLVWQPIEATDTAMPLQPAFWSFQPEQARELAALRVAKASLDIQQRVAQAPVDRRYDEKLTWLTNALVGGLERRNQSLAQSCQKLQLAQERLAHQTALATVGQLTSTIAHDIRNPLGTMQLYTHLAQEKLKRLLPNNTSTTEVQEALSIVQTSIEALETMLGEMTQYGRPLALQLQSVSLQQWLADQVSFFKPTVVAKNVSLVFNPNELPTPALCSIDSDKLAPAFLNVLKNALEVSPSGSTITVRIAEDSTCWHIQVIDQGGGLDKAAQARLFMPYFSTKASGTGLGLAHARKIALLHGGDLLLQKTAETGSVFAFVLPKSFA